MRVRGDVVLTRPRGATDERLAHVGRDPSVAAGRRRDHHHPTPQPPSLSRTCPRPSCPPEAHRRERRRAAGAVRDGLLGLAVEDAVVRACRLADAGETATAVATLEQALALAAPERLRRPFLDAPAQLRPLLRAHPELTAAGAWLNPTAPAVPAPRHPVDPAAGSALRVGSPAVIGELSPRERDVLQHLAEMLSTAEIAAALFVSVNTVRTHVRSILRKLDVTRRNEAVRRARELGLLEPAGAPSGAAPSSTAAPGRTAMQDTAHPHHASAPG